MTKPKPEIRVEWRKRTEVAPGVFDREPALHYFAEPQTGGLLAHVFESMPVMDGRSLAKELEARGYDLTTLRFSIRRKEPR